MDLLFIKGINERRLISRPTQQPSQFEEEIAKAVPRISVKEKRARAGFKRIRMGALPIGRV